MFLYREIFQNIKLDRKIFTTHNIEANYYLHQRNLDTFPIVIVLELYQSQCIDQIYYNNIQSLTTAVVPLSPLTVLIIWFANHSFMQFVIASEISDSCSFIHRVFSICKRQPTSSQRRSRSVFMSATVVKLILDALQWMNSFGVLFMYARRMLFRQIWIIHQQLWKIFNQKAVFD